MSTVLDSRASIINPTDHIVDLVRREIDAIGRGAKQVLAKTERQDKDTGVGVLSAAHALAKLERAYAPVLSRKPMLSGGTGAALSTLRSSVSVTGPAVQRALQVVGMDDSGSGDNLGTGTGADTGLGNSGGAVGNGAAVETFEQYDPPTQAAATSFYDVNAAGMVDDMFTSELNGLRDQLGVLFQNDGANAAAAGADAANNAANNLGTAAGVALGAIIAGPIGAAIGAFVGAAVFSFARSIVHQMMEAFQDLWNEVFG